MKEILEDEITEKEKMLGGEVYDPYDYELMRAREKALALAYKYNNTAPQATAEREMLIKRIFGRTGETICVMQPIHFDYGFLTEVGENFYSNYNFTVLDGGGVKIGDNAFIGPNVSIYTACHPLRAEERNKGIEWAKEVVIGNNVWIGGSVSIGPGVHIGDNVVIGFGSVVVKDIPSDSVAVGNPAVVIKKIEK